MGHAPSSFSVAADANPFGIDVSVGPARLHEAAATGNSRAFREVFDTLSQPQRQSLCRGLLVDGVSLLQAAATSGNFQIIDTLLEHGAEVNRMNRYAGSALHECVSAACSSGGEGAMQEDLFATCLAHLLEAGADPFLENMEGMTAMQIASKQSRQLSRVVTGSTGRCADVLRLLETRAHACGMLQIQAFPFTSRDFHTVWAVLAPRRYSQPFGAAPKDRSRELWCYGSPRDLKPQFKCLVDGCIINRQDGGLRVLLLPFYLKRSPQRCFFQICDSGERWAFTFKAVQDDVESRVVFNDFVSAFAQLSAATSRHRPMQASIALPATALTMPEAALAAAAAASSSMYLNAYHVIPPGHVVGAVPLSMPPPLQLPPPPTSVSPNAEASVRASLGRRIGGSSSSIALSTPSHHLRHGSRTPRSMGGSPTTSNTVVATPATPNAGAATSSTPVPLISTAADSTKREDVAGRLGASGSSVVATAAAPPAAASSEQRCDAAINLCTSHDVMEAGQQSASAAQRRLEYPTSFAASGVMFDDAERGADASAHLAAAGGCLGGAATAYAAQAAAVGPSSVSTTDAAGNDGAHASDYESAGLRDLSSRQSSYTAEEAVAERSVCIICMDAAPTIGFRHGFSVHKCVCYVCAQGVVTKGDGGAVLCPLCRAVVQDVLVVY